MARDTGASWYNGEANDFTEAEKMDMEVYLAQVNAVLRGPGHHCIGNRVMQMWQAVRRPPFGQELGDENGPAYGDFHVPFSWPFAYNLACRSNRFRDAIRAAIAHPRYASNWKVAAVYLLAQMDKY
jgi:hypothetical protein